MRDNKTTLILTVDSPAYGGLFLGRYKGKIVMIGGAAIPGETVEVHIKKEKKDYLIAEVAEIIKPSPFRTQPGCKYFGSCGGCHLQFMTYEKQVQIKEEILRDCLKRIAKIEVSLSESIVNDKPWSYRRRGQFKISHGNIGFFRAKTKKLIDIDNCPLMMREVNKNLNGVRKLLKGIDSGEIHISCGDGCIAMIKASACNKKSVAGIESMSSMFLRSGFSGLCIELSDGKVLRYGKPYITLDLANLQYTVSPMSFFQSNWRLNQTVVNLIRENLRSFEGKKILDLFAGAGNFSLLLAHNAGIIAVEENPFAVEDGKRNVKINSISNFRFIRSSAENFCTKENIQIVILDPPRQGVSGTVVNKVLNMSPEKIVYISCNPATFARDMKRLLVRYDIESVRMIDFFPHTFHIESLAFLRLK